MLHFFGWGIRWAIATVFFLAVMAAAGYYVFTQALSGGEHVTVPNVVGMNISLASLRITELGLEIGKPALVSHKTIEQGIVLAQRPSADDVVRTGRKVALTVSGGADFLQAPNLLMKDWDSVQEEIANSQFQVGHVARIPHTARRDTVLAQDPQPGLTIRNNDPINVLLSAGDETSMNFMPNILGMTEEELRQALQTYGVELKRVEVSGEGLETGVVLEQEPAADSEVFSGDTVTYKIKAAAPEDVEEYRAEIVHKWPNDWYAKDIRVLLVDRNGNREEVAHHAPVSATDAEAASRMAGYGRKYPFTYPEQAMLEIYEDGKLSVTYYVKDGNAPMRRDVP